MRLSQRLAPVLPHHAVAHDGGVFKIAGDILNEFTMLMRSDKGSYRYGRSQYLTSVVIG